MDIAEREVRHLKELHNLEAILKDMGFPAQLLQKSEPILQNALVTRLVMPQDQPSLEMALTFYPVEPNTVQHAMLLQYYVEFPFDFDDGTLEQYCNLVPDLNAKTVLGHFSLDRERGKAFYRYVQILPIDRPITKPAVIDVIILVGYTPVFFIEILSALASKKLDAAAARERLQIQH